MACVVEIPVAGATFNDEMHLSVVEEESHSVDIGPVDLELGIPTFDASDLDQHLEKSKSERFIGKSLIVLASNNPLPLLRLALIRAHTRTTVEPSRFLHHKQLFAWDVNGSSFANDEVASALRREQLVDNLPLSTQLAFRRQVLLMLLLYVGLISVLIFASLLCIPWTAFQGLLEQSPYLAPVTAVGLASITLLSLWLVYVLRFDAPANYGALTFLTVSETACAVAYGVTHGPEAVVETIGLFLVGIVLLRELSSKSTSGLDDELICPAQAALRSIVVLAAGSIPVNAFLGEAVTHTTTSSLICVLGLVSLLLLWISLVLAALSQTMIPEEVSSALVFFQADLIVLVVVEPSHVVLKYVRRLKSTIHPFREKDDDTLPSKNWSQPNIVVPAFWPRHNDSSDASALCQTSRYNVALYRADLSSHRPHVDPQDASPVVISTSMMSPFMMESSLNHAAGHRRRNSTADD